MAVLFASLLISLPALSAIQASASVSDTNVVVGDIFILTVSINDNDDYRLDTRELEQDFTVYLPSQSKRSEYINGTFSQETEWRVRLQAKKQGSFIIPAFKIGAYLTEPIEIKVSDVSEANTEQNNDIFIENSINKDSVYIGQSFIYTSKLYISKNSNDLDLKAPHFEGAENSVLGKDQTDQIIRNGIRYNTITRQYKMTATEAGQYEIDSPLLTGTVQELVAVSDRQNRVVSKTINVRGERLNIDIKDIPADYQGQWLVSDDLRLIENNDLSAQTYKVGEPITRSITLQIANIEKEKLPNIKLNYPDSLRFYPDQDELQEGTANNLSYGVRIIRHAIIADKVGTLTLPEITLNWYNSQTNEQQTARLPEQKLTIIAADKQPTNTPPVIQPIATQPSPTIIVDNSALIYWQITVAILIIIMILMTVYHFYYRRLVALNSKREIIQAIPSSNNYLLLQESLKQQNASASYSALLRYAQWQYSDLKSLSQYAQKTSLDETDKKQLTDEIQRLQQCCSDPSKQWDSSNLASLIIKLQTNEHDSPQQDPMNLNP